MKFQFDSNQKFQNDAISSVVDLFRGQSKNAGSVNRMFSPFDNLEKKNLDLGFEIGSVGNHLMIDDSTILENLGEIQNRNGLQPSATIPDSTLHFDIEMETGTGKTYVYLRTIFELYKNYDFRKFIILVPSIAIKEGVKTSINLMTEHFNELYAIPFDVTVYSGKNAEQVQSFSNSTNLQIMIMTIDSVKGDKNNRIMHQNRDKLNGLKPIDYIKYTNPILIMDEPQNMEGELSVQAIKELSPLCTLRYSATPKTITNLVYRLDPIDAHEMGLVKQILVSDVLQEGPDVQPYMKLVDVRREPEWHARLELAIRNKEGKILRKIVKVKNNDNLFDASNLNPAYENNWIVNGINLKPASIELTNHGLLNVGESIGGNNDSIYREMIRETVEEHFRKEIDLIKRGVKVLSLFFVDKVSNYISYEDANLSSKGKFAIWFDEIFSEVRNSSAKYRELYPLTPEEYRKAYFAEMKEKNSSHFVDSSESGNARDNEAFDLIMKNKARLLDENEPVRFIFSHSALREGWDNPNVFQICALREMGSSIERRQTIGRGLRLPVNQIGERISDRNIAQLTVIASESYSVFASKLQEEYVDSGVSIGFIREGEFSKLPELDSDLTIGFNKSKSIWQELLANGFIDQLGKVQSSFTPYTDGFTLNLSSHFSSYEVEIIKIIERFSISNIIRQKRHLRTRKLNKEIYDSPEFEKFWSKISAKTSYRVKVDTNSIITAVLDLIANEPVIRPLRIQKTKAGLRIQRDSAVVEELSAPRITKVDFSYDLPDLVYELQEATSLTRITIIDILLRIGRLQEFIDNPNDFIQMVKKSIKTVLSQSVISGIQYQKIAGSIYELSELKQDGFNERETFVDKLYSVRNKQKTDFDQIFYSSKPERQFAELLDSRDDIKLFIKLPSKFKIPTPVGAYNPDWAILKVEDGEERIYMIRETKSTDSDLLLRGSEVDKIKCGRKHFESIGIFDFEKSTPDNWNLN